MFCDYNVCLFACLWPIYNGGPVGVINNVLDTYEYFESRMDANW